MNKRISDGRKMDSKEKRITVNKNSSQVSDAVSERIMCNSASTQDMAHNKLNTLNAVDDNKLVQSGLIDPHSQPFSVG